MISSCTNILLNTYCFKLTELIFQDYHLLIIDVIRLMYVCLMVLHTIKYTIMYTL